MEEIFKNLIESMINAHMTDAHFKTLHTPVIEVRHRGHLVPFLSYELQIYQQLVRYLIYHSNIDLNLKTKPQTGAFEYAFNQRIYYFRLSYLPSGNDIHLVLRLLNHEHLITFDSMSTAPYNITKWKHLLAKQAGLIVVCGPTGSGKSTTLHACLHEFISKGIYSIVSIEDPIEIHQDGMVQIEVNEKLGLDFDVILKQILRHDPDIVMIGEIRDQTSAALALRLALTGHLVLTTLHATDIQTGKHRLANLMHHHEFESVLIGMASQRLIYPENEDPLVIFEIANKEELQQDKITYSTLFFELMKEKEHHCISDTLIESFSDS